MGSGDATRAGTRAGAGTGSGRGAVFSADATVALIFAQTTEEHKSEKKEEKITEARRTFFKVSFEANSFAICVGALGVVRLAVLNHKMEVCLELLATSIHAILDLDAHSLQVHGRLNDLEVTVDDHH